MKKYVWCRMLAMLLSVSMLTSALPAAARAAGTGAEPAAVASAEPSAEPTAEPTAEPSVEPSAEPSVEPTAEPSSEPTAEPSSEPAEPTEGEPLPAEETPEPSEDAEEPEEIIRVKFDLGDGTATTVEVTESHPLTADQIPTENSAGRKVDRWKNAYDSNINPLTEHRVADTTYYAWYAPSLVSNHSPYVSGVSATEFQPNRSMTRAEAVAMVYNLVADKTYGSYPHAYKDVSSSAWYYRAVTAMASLGVLDCDWGAFRPNSPITRGEFADLVSRFAELKDYSSSFPDLKAGDPYYDAVVTCAANGWISGFEDGTFRPNESLTRAQAVSIMNKMQGRSADPNVIASHSAELKPFWDVKPGSWYYAAVMEAANVHTAASVSGGVETWATWESAVTYSYTVNGTTTTEWVYPGNKPVSVPTVSGLSTWKDQATGCGCNPSDYTAAEGQNRSFIAVQATYFVSNWHDVYLYGYSDGTARPNAKISRGELCSILYQILGDKSKGSYPCTYPDVDHSASYYEAVTVLASRGYLKCNGQPFYAFEAVGRGELCEILASMTTPVSIWWSYSDVPAGSKHYTAVNTCAGKCWLGGNGNGIFDTETAVTRAMLAVVINRITGRTGDTSAIQDMDDRYTYSDLPKSHWAYTAMMEAMVHHNCWSSGGSEVWSTYNHPGMWTNWEKSSSVVSAATITTSDISCNYSGFYVGKNYDYSTAAKEKFINSNGYSSSTHWLLWVNRATQKVNVFYSSTGNAGTWTLYDVFTAGTGKSGTPTPVGVTYVTYRQTGWFESSYKVAPVVRFYPGTGYAFHSRLYYPGSSTALKDGTIGQPCSHGCVRMLTPDVTWIYNNIPQYTRVVVY